MCFMIWCRFGKFPLKQKKMFMWQRHFLSRNRRPQNKSYCFKGANVSLYAWSYCIGLDKYTLLFYLGLGQFPTVTMHSWMFVKGHIQECLEIYSPLQLPIFNFIGYKRGSKCSKRFSQGNLVWNSVKVWLQIKGLSPKGSHPLKNNTVLWKTFIKWWPLPPRPVFVKSLFRFLTVNFATKSKCDKTA